MPAFGWRDGDYTPVGRIMGITLVKQECFGHTRYIAWFESLFLGCGYNS